MREIKKHSLSYGCPEYLGTWSMEPWEPATAAKVDRWEEGGISDHQQVLRRSASPGNLTVSGSSHALRASGQLSGWDYSSDAVTVDVNITVDATGNYSSR